MKKRSNLTTTGDGSSKKKNEFYQRASEINEKGKSPKKKKAQSDSRRSEVSVDLNNKEEMKLKFSVFQ